MKQCRFVSLQQFVVSLFVLRDDAVDALFARQMTCRKNQADEHQFTELKNEDPIKSPYLPPISAHQSLIDQYAVVCRNHSHNPMRARGRRNREGPSHAQHFED